MHKTLISCAFPPAAVVVVPVFLRHSSIETRCNPYSDSCSKHINRAMVKLEVVEQPDDVMEDYMARKRTPKDSTPSETPTPVQSEPEQQLAAPVATTESEAPAPEAAEGQPSFVQRIQRQRGRAITSDPFGIAGDVEAGVRLFESRRFRQMAIKFEEKPSQEVLDLVKSAGYRWNANDFMWVHPMKADSDMTTRIEAERLYQEVRGMIRQAKGIESGQEVPF